MFYIEERIMFMYEKRLPYSGFTLAEVLITLGIIGVVAAMTMPVLIANKRAKELETGLKKNASVIAQALNLYQADTGTVLLPGDAANWEELRDIFILKYFKVLRDCGRGYINGECVLNNGWGADDNSTIYTTLNGNTLNLHEFDDGQYVLNDGSFLMIEYSISTATAELPVSKFYISVDVNGLSKAPNRLGQDLFMFEIDKNGKFLPMGAEGTSYYDKNDVSCSFTSNSNMNGAGCTYKALSDPNYFKNLP